MNNKQPNINKLWAPWRVAYIKSARKTKGCLFCGLSKENNDKLNLIAFRSKHSFSILNKYPYNNGHLLICPYKHTKNLSGLTTSESSDLLHTLTKMQGALEDILNPDGFNIGINVGACAGAGIPGHLHIHLVPRWNQDTNFMPVVNGTKVISESLEALYGQLYKKIRG